MGKRFFALIPTGLGTAAVLASEAGLTGFVWPRRPASAARRAALQREPKATERSADELCAGLARRVADYFAGRAVDFADVPVDLSGLPPFHARALRALRRIGYGHTISYGGLARRVGRPGGARAVGQAMAGNPIPVILPCHRVLRSDGGLGGFSADEGVTLKRRLLEMEAKADR